MYFTDVIPRRPLLFFALFTFCGNWVVAPTHQKRDCRGNDSVVEESPFNSENGSLPEVNFTVGLTITLREKQYRITCDRTTLKGGANRLLMADSTQTDIYGETNAVIIHLIRETLNALLNWWRKISGKDSTRFALPAIIDVLEVVDKSAPRYGVISMFLPKWTREAISINADFIPLVTPKKRDLPSKLKHEREMLFKNTIKFTAAVFAQRMEVSFLDPMLTDHGLGFDFAQALSVERIAVDERGIPQLVDIPMRRPSSTNEDSLAWRALKAFLENFVRKLATNLDIVHAEALLGVGYKTFLKLNVSAKQSADDYAKWNGEQGVDFSKGAYGSNSPWFRFLYCCWPRGTTIASANYCPPTLKTRAAKSIRAAHDRVRRRTTNSGASLHSWFSAIFSLNLWRRQ